MKCLILASGFGTRLYPLTMNRAKALLPYKGKPMINHIVDRIPPGTEILVNVNMKFEQDFREWAGSQDRPVTICVENVRSDDEKMGAIGSLNYWIKQKNITEDLLLFGCDNYFEFDLSLFIGAYDGRHVLVAIYDVGHPSKATQYGVVRIEGNRIIELEEKPSVPKTSLVSTACWIVPPRVFPIISAFCDAACTDNLGFFIAHLVGIDTVCAYPFEDLWIDIGNLEIYHATK
jgi:glucose-1-phosphate thymidylyltransferase